MKILVDAVSSETAYVQPDYPYSFRLRCERRCWVETKKGHGQRFVTQTSNPKRPGMWNKPKAGVYHAIVVLVLSETEHVNMHCLGGYDEDERIDAFVAHFGTGLSEYQRKAILWLRAGQRAQKRVTVTITCGLESEESRQTLEEQREIMRSLVVDELRRGDLS